MLALSRYMNPAPVFTLCAPSGTRCAGTVLSRTDPTFGASMTPAQPRLPHETPQDLLHAVALNIGAPMACLNWPDGRCTWANAAYAQLLDMPVQELLGQAPLHYLAPCNWKRWKCELERLASACTQGASLQTPLVYARDQCIPTLLIAQKQGGQVNAIIVMPQHNLSLLDAAQLVQD